MMTNTCLRRCGMTAIASGLAGATIYLIMIKVTLAHIEVLTGQAPFDMRPFGYGPQETALLLDALGENGRNYYLTRQLPLDMVYPALLATTLISAILWLGKHQRNRKIIHAGIAVSAGVAVFDYLENLGVAAMILNWPSLSHGLVNATSVASVSKSCLTVAAISAMLVLGFIRIRGEPKP